MPRDKQLRCPYCSRFMGRNRDEYGGEKYCPGCGAKLPSANHSQFDRMMKGARVVKRACPISVIVAAVTGLLFG